ncbi:MAG: hypothetical protein NW204_13415 [Xanthomonadaceae bacterium]|nr:hypothetical protein [Xanthomonadaceae bacterium]
MAAGRLRPSEVRPGTRSWSRDLLLRLQQAPNLSCHGALESVIAALEVER